jgi:arylsulfatase B
MCSPTRAGLMTGRYAMRMGMARSVVRPWARFGLPPAERTLPEALADAGYAHRGAFGKWHLGHLGPQWHPLAQGFTTFKGMYNGAGDYFTRLRNGEPDWHADHEPVAEEGYTTDLVAAAATSFIERHAGDGPFFCYVPFSAPHDPLQAPKETIERFAALDDNAGDNRPSDRQKLAAMISRMDDGVGRILGALDKAGVAKNTIVWFFSDNGGIRSIPNNNTPLRGSKLTVYEGGVRVPAAVWWPGVIEGGRKIDSPVMNIDVMPTVLALGGPPTAVDSPAPGPLDGIDVSPVLTGKQAKTPPRDLYYFHGQDGPQTEQIAVTSGDGWKLVVKGPDVRREGGYRTPAHTVELFNLSEDPLERTDRATDHPQTVAKLGEKVLLFRRSEPADSLPPINRAPPGFRPPAQWRNAPAEVR